MGHAAPFVSLLSLIFFCPSTPPRPFPFLFLRRKQSEEPDLPNNATPRAQERHNTQTDIKKKNERTWCIFRAKQVVKTYLRSLSRYCWCLSLALAKSFFSSLKTVSRVLPFFLFCIFMYRVLRTQTRRLHCLVQQVTADQEWSKLRFFLKKMIGQVLWRWRRSISR